MTMISRKYYPSEYKYVANMKQNGKDGWCVNMAGISKSTFNTERQAAIAVDKIMIRNGKDPVNILVRK